MILTFTNWHTDVCLSLFSLGIVTTSSSLDSHLNITKKIWKICNKSSGCLTDTEYFFYLKPALANSKFNNKARKEQSSHIPCSSHQRLKHFWRKDKNYESVKVLVFKNQVVAENTINC